MLITTPLPGLRLESDQVARLRWARGVRIEAREGHLWVTHDGRPDDRLLQAGEAWEVPDDADVLVSAFRGDALMHVHAPSGRRASASLTVRADEGGGVGRWLARLGVPLGDVL